MKRSLALLTTVLLMSVVTSLYALTDKAKSENQQESIAVNNSKGEYVGTLTNVLVDSDGNIGFIIVSIGHDRNQDKKDIAVPLITFFYDREKRLLILDVSTETLLAAPEFKTSDLGDPAFAERTYRYFGLMPSWTTEGDE